MFYILFICYIVLSSLGLLFIKLGGSGTNFLVQTNIVSLNISYKLILGLIFYICSFLLYVWVVQKKNLSIIVPLSAGIGNVVSVLLGILVLKEKLSSFGLIGVTLVIIGVVFLTWKG